MIRVGIIGLGRQSLNDHIPAVLRQNNLQIVGVVDTNRTAHQNFQKLFPDMEDTVKLFAKIEDLLDLGIDFAIIALPHNHYLTAYKLLAKNKIPFMKEKPFARNLDEAIAIARIPDIEKYCFTCTQRRFNPLYQRAHERLKSFGRLASFSATYTLNITEPASGWRGNFDICGGGVIVDMGYHIIDQLVWWFGYPDEIHASISNLSNDEACYDTEDAASVIFTYRKLNLHGAMILSRCTGVKMESYQVAGDRSFMDGSKRGLTILDRKTGESIYQKEHDYGEQMMDAQLEAFLENILQNRDFRDNIYANLLNMKFIEQCYRGKISRDQALFINDFKRKTTRGGSA